MVRKKFALGAALVALLVLLWATGGVAAGLPVMAPLSDPSISFGTPNVVGHATASVEALVTGDLDNDGDPDLVSANGGIIAWQNDGAPFASAWMSQSLGTVTTSVYALAAGDLDNDGYLDLVSGHDGAADYELRVWQNDGSPFVGKWAFNDAGAPGKDIRTLAIGDLDNDGDLDIVTGDASGMVVAWKNEGTPFSEAWSGNNLGSAGGDVRTLAIGDLDQDGDLDVVSGDSDNTVIAWQNDQTPFNGFWASLRAFTAADSINSLSLVDLDSDGDLDIVGGCGSGEDYEITSWENDGTPFSAAWAQHDIASIGVSVYAIAAADFDVDGDPDLASGSQVDPERGEVYAWENNGSPFGGTWAGSEVWETGAYVRALATPDLDLDGDPDLVASSSDIIAACPNTRIPETLGNWAEGPQPSPIYGTLSAALGDLDHDGWLDIAAGTIDKGVYIWRGNGGYSWTRVGAGDLPWDGVWTDVSWAQIDNDHELDLAAANANGGLRAWAGKEGGVNWVDISSGLPTSDHYNALTLGYVRRDGWLDLVACHHGQGVQAWEGHGTSWSFKTVLSDTLDFSDVALGNVDHDGNLDIAAAGRYGAGIPIWLGNGEFGFTCAPSPAASGSYQAVALGDLDNDGNTDIVAAPATGVDVWLGNGGSKWTHKDTISPTLTIISLDLGDFDNDGYLDILAGLKDAGVRVWKNQAGKAWADASTKLPTTGRYQDVAFDRIDGDAHLDIVAAESGGSGVHVWTAVEPPPGGWTGFEPSSWARTPAVTCTVQVADVGSGLDVSTAEYRFSKNGGASWESGWQPAECSGSDGTTDPQVITAAEVPFSQDSADQNAIQFRIQDMAVFTGTSPIYNVLIDTRPPFNPTPLYGSHTPEEWDNKNHIGIWWDTAGTDDTSGVLGYSWDLTQSAFDRPDEDFDAYIGTYGASEYAHTDGTWYFHFMTGDVAGNWANPVHLGPYLIDASPPTTPTLVSSSHTVGGWSTDNTIEVSWTSSDEGGSGIAGYSYQWSRFTTTLLDTTIDTTDSFTTSDPLDDARWYLVVRAIDGAGSSSGVAAFGPFGVDTRPPGSGEIHSPEFAYSPSFAVHWSYQDGGSGVLNYDVRFSDDGRVSWTDWLTNTTLTSATFADGQNWHTYYFSVRARDELGNLSSYYPESHTLVKIPPHVTGFSPASGFAGAGQSSSPLQLVPGSMVDITGIGFTEGSVTFNSVPWDHVHSQVVDDTHIRAAVGAGTSGSGPVCVHTSLGDDCSNILFTVVPDKPFPVRWGLGFDNFSTRSSGMGWGIFEKAFGKCEVNTCVSSYLGIPVPCRWCPDWALVPRPDTGLFFFASRGIAKGGDCYGISYLTMDFYKGMKDPDDFAAGADVPASLSWHTPNLADEIRARQWRQLSIENLSFEVGQVLLYELAGPVRMRTWMETQWALGQPTMLCMEHGSEGHCVNPYEVVGDNIHLYDNNYPYINNNYPQGGDGCTGHDYLDQALERFIDVDTAHWSYPGASCEPGNWGGDWPGQYIIGLPYAVVAGPHHPLSDLLGMDALFFGSDGAAHSIVEDAEGRIIGYDESGQLTQTIPITDAMPIIPFQDGAPPFEGYYLSEGGNYTVHVNGISSGTYSTTLLADGGTTFVVEDVPLKPDTHDGLGFDRGDGSPTGESLFTLTTTDSGKDVSATIVRPADGGSEQRRCSVNNLTIGDGTPLTMTTDGEADSLVISGGAGSTYDVCFYRLAEGQVPGEFCWGGINLGAGDRHILTPQDWDRLGSTQVRLDIDEGGDGTVDETQWLVGHGLALSMHGEPTVIHSGDLLTYTLIYTITGEEVAPGVVLTSTVPISTTFVDATGGVTPQEGALTWILGSLTPPASGQEAFTVKVGSVPEDTIVGTMAYLRDESGRWAMAGSTSAGPAYPAHRIYLPIIVKRYSH